MKLSPLAGKPAPLFILIDVSTLQKAYYNEVPNPEIAEERVLFGTSGHRGTSLKRSFNEKHILAITQAICEWRKNQGIDGPLFLGIDTHALSEPALQSALEVLSFHNVDVVVSAKEKYTPTPAISHAILNFNRGKKTGLADGIVITPSHNPPDAGGFKYNSTNGGPADVNITDWIQKRANEWLSLDVPKAAVLKTRAENFLHSYVEDLKNVIDFDLVKGSKIHLGVDPLGGAGVHYWQQIQERYKIDLTVVSQVIDPTFAFMTVDWDGQIRMDPSSPYAMERLIGLKNRFQVAFACDTDHDRHGIVTKRGGLMPPNKYLSAAVFYLFQHRPNWGKNVAIGKTVVTSQMIDRVAKKLGRELVEVPVGFKWFVKGLLKGELGFGGEESAGASFLRKDGTVWTTDKDGIILALLSGEMTAKLGKDPAELYLELEKELGTSFTDRVEAHATAEQKKKLKNIHISPKKFAGEKVISVATNIGGVKVVTENGWFAARPSGTEEIYKIYAESFCSEEHLKRMIQEAKEVVDVAIA